MGILERIKKRQIDGFKEFVQNMETTGAQKRVPIFTAGILEDPVFMSWVMKNIRTFDDIFTLNSDDLDIVLKSSDQIISVFAKCMHGSDEKKLMELESVIPKHMSKFKDEYSYIKELDQRDKDAAKLFLLKSVRQLQMKESIIGFSWKLPPMDVFYPKTNKDGPSEVYFESSVLAAVGEYLKNKRCGLWRHYYETGKLLAEGNYNDGLKSGVWVFFYGNGDKRSEGVYKGDQRNGVWKEWDRHGNMTEGEFLDGVKQED